MGLKFNIDRPKVSDEEIAKNQDFQKLVQRFKEQSIKKARGDESWWKNKSVRYSTVIAGITVVCVITYSALFNSQQQKTVHEKITTNTKNQVQVKRQIAPPSDKLAVKKTNYTVNNQKGANLTHSSGSKLKIPANSFVDKNGKQIIGDVTIEYREFHTIPEVIGSGIPMQYDSAGTSRQLETAGMFDISGNQNGAPVELAKDKKIDIELSSLKNRNNFHQYKFDTAAGNWVYLQADKLQTTQPQQTSAPLTNKIDLLKKQVEVIIPARLDSVELLTAKKIKQLPLYQAPAKPRAVTKGRPSFTFEGNASDFPELAAFNNVLFEVGSENKNYTPELHDITWEDVKITQGPVKGTNYLLTLKYRARTERLVVYPVLSGKDLEKATELYSKRFNEYTTLSSKREAEEARLKADLEAKQAAYFAEQKAKENELLRLQKELKQLEQQRAQQEQALLANQNKAVRLFSISAFGIYNSDCPHTPVKNARLINPVFVDGNGKPLLPKTVYLINYNNQTAASLSKENGFSAQISSTTEYAFCCLVGDKLFACTKAATNAALANKNNRFEAIEIMSKDNSLQTLKEALNL